MSQPQLHPWTQIVADIRRVRGRCRQWYDGKSVPHDLRESFEKLLERCFHKAHREHDPSLIETAAAALESEQRDNVIALHRRLYPNQYPAK